MFTKKRVIAVMSLVFIGILGTFGFNRLNNFIEWKMAAEAVGAMPVQIGDIDAQVVLCQPSCTSINGSNCCIATPPGLGPMCTFFVPGINGTYDSGCPLFSSVTGTQAGGTGFMALLSNLSIAEAGLVTGGQFIYGGTTENMSELLPAAPNTILASTGGCYGCVAKNSPEWQQKLAMLYKVVIAGFKK